MNAHITMARAVKCTIRVVKETANEERRGLVVYGEAVGIQISM